jgi:hypothetical protein
LFVAQELDEVQDEEAIELLGMLTERMPWRICVHGFNHVRGAVWLGWSSPQAAIVCIRLTVKI